MRHLTKKQEAFCLKYIKLDNVAEAARQAGYSPRWAVYNTTHLLDKPLIQARIKELHQKVVDDSIMSAQERRQRLSVIGRGQGFIKPVQSIQAIDILNKMDRIYSEVAQVNIDNRKIEIIVVSERAKELTQAILQGQRT